MDEVISKVPTGEYDTLTHNLHIVDEYVCNGPNRAVHSTLRPQFLCRMNDLRTGAIIEHQTIN
jgi:hypothetical protein